MSPKQDAVQTLVLAALDLLDCKDLTPAERLKADEIYALAGDLEDAIENPEET